ncbi:hypothetical protein MD484_g500, partial [Candolleomyces efflorescens]
MSISEAPHTLSHHSSSNTAQDSFESAVIRKDQYDTVIERLPLESRNLEGERQRCERLLPLGGKLLPVELLGEVFALIIYPLFDELDLSDRDLVGYNVGRARNGLVDLCLVCRAWRDAAHATPSLWSRLDLYWGSLDVEKVCQWFKLARGAPLSLIIHTPDWFYDSLTEDHLNILEGLITEGPPLDRLELYLINAPGDDEGDGETALQRLANLLERANGAKLETPPRDSLRSFGLQLHGGYAEASHVVIPNLPHLRNLHLRLPGFDEGDWDEPGQPLVPFDISRSTLERLTELTLSYCDWTAPAILALVRWCTSVETMTVCFSSVWPAWVEVDEPFLQALLPAVHSLRLLNLSRDLNDILRLIRAPSLVELDLTFDLRDSEGCYDYPDDPDYQYPNLESLESNIISLVKNSDGTVDLRHLRLRTLFISSRSLISILTNLPSITHLTLDEVQFDSTLFKEIEAAGSNCLPHLEVLELLNVPSSFHIPDLYEFVASRKSFGQPDVAGMEGTNRLKELTITVIPPSKVSELGLLDADDALREHYYLTLYIGYAHSRQG